MKDKTTDISQRLEFIRQAGKLKDTLRSAYTDKGRTESAAEHSWRLTLFILTFADMLPDIDLLKLLKICILHDLGEAVNGDIPAPQQQGGAVKSTDERKDFKLLLAPLPTKLQQEFLALWDDYENGISMEAKIAKAFDKLETIIQHNQGENPVNFDYAFNLGYGRKHTDLLSFTDQIRHIVDSDTAANASRTERLRHNKTKQYRD